MELIAATGGVGIQVLDDIFPKDGFGMPVVWDLGKLVNITSITNIVRLYGNCRTTISIPCSFGHFMMVVERVSQKRLHEIVTVDEMQFGFMPERGTIDAMFILKRMPEEYRLKGKKVCGPRESFWQNTK